MNSLLCTALVGNIASGIFEFVALTAFPHVHHENAPNRSQGERSCRGESSRPGCRGRVWRRQGGRQSCHLRQRRSLRGGRCGVAPRGHARRDGGETETAAGGTMFSSRRPPSTPCFASSLRTTFRRREGDDWRWSPDGFLRRTSRGVGPLCYCGEELCATFLMLFAGPFVVVKYLGRLRSRHGATGEKCPE